MSQRHNLDDYESFEGNLEHQGRKYAAPNAEAAYQAIARYKMNRMDYASMRRVKAGKRWHGVKSASDNVKLNRSSNGSKMDVSIDSSFETKASSLEPKINLLLNQKNVDFNLGPHSIPPKEKATTAKLMQNFLREENTSTPKVRRYRKTRHAPRALAAQYFDSTDDATELYNAGKTVRKPKKARASKNTMRNQNENDATAFPFNSTEHLQHKLKKSEYLPPVAGENDYNSVKESKKLYNDHANKEKIKQLKPQECKTAAAKNEPNLNVFNSDYFLEMMKNLSSIVKKQKDNLKPKQQDHAKRGDMKNTKNYNAGNFKTYAGENNFQYEDQDNYYQNNRNVGVAGKYPDKNQDYERQKHSQVGSDHSESGHCGYSSLADENCFEECTCSVQSPGHHDESDESTTYQSKVRSKLKYNANDTYKHDLNESVTSGTTYTEQDSPILQMYKISPAPSCHLTAKTAKKHTPYESKYSTFDMFPSASTSYTKPATKGKRAKHDNVYKNSKPLKPGKYRITTSDSAFPCSCCNDNFSFCSCDSCLAPPSCSTNDCKFCYKYESDCGKSFIIASEVDKQPLVKPKKELAKPWRIPNQRKNKSFSNERLREIKRDNMILFKKIKEGKPTYKFSKPTARNLKVSKWQSPRKETKFTINQRKQQLQIDSENKKLTRRIREIQSRRSLH